jgi:DNA-binding transcriptional ArsR family regulator
MSRDYEIDFSTLPTDDEGIPLIELGDDTYRLPYYDLIEQTVDIGALVESIEAEGIEYPIIVDEQTNNVIDGMTRLYIATQILDLPEDEIPIKVEDIILEDEQAGWMKAIELNANRRQISRSMRQKLIQRIMDRSRWRKARSHVSDLARMLGVSKSTISRDLDQIGDSSEVQELKKRKRTLNVSLTGMRNVKSFLEEGEIVSDLDEDEQERYQDMLDELVSIVEEEREAISDTIDESE